MLQDGNPHAESMEESTVKDKNVLQELDATKEQLENLSKRYEELEAKSKADIKVLVKEVKSLRSSQIGLKQELSQMLNEKSKTEVIRYSASSFVLCQVSVFKKYYACHENLYP